MTINNPYFLPILNGLLYTFSLILYQKLKRRFDLGSIILLLFTFSNITSIIYFSIDFVRPNFTKLTLFPYLYLFLLFLICIYPILNLDTSKIFAIRAIGGEKFVYFLSFFFAIISIDPFFEHLLHIISNPKGSSADYLGQIYAGDIKGDLFLSWFARKFNYILSLFRIVVVVLFFYNIKRKSNKFIIIGLALGIGNNILASYSGASRGGVIENMMPLVTSFVLFKNIIDEKIVKRILLLGSIIIIVIIFFIGFITISRFNYSNNTNSIIQWVSLYTGEGSLRFNNDMWYLKEHLHGANIFSIKDASVIREHYYSKTGQNVEVFFTFIGDFVLDFGLWGAPLLCIFIFILLSNLTRKQKVYSLDKIILIVAFSQIFLIGFTAYIYRSVEGNIYPTLLIVLVLYLLRVAPRSKVSTRY